MFSTLFKCNIPRAIPHCEGGSKSDKISFFFKLSTDARYLEFKFRRKPAYVISKYECSILGGDDDF